MKLPSLPPLSQLPHWVLVLGPVLCALLAFAIIRTYLTSIAIRLFKQQGLSYNQKHEKSIMIPFGLTAFLPHLLWSPMATCPRKSSANHLLSPLPDRTHPGYRLGNHKLCGHLFLYCEKKAQKTRSKFDDALVPLLRSGAKLVVIAVGLVFVGHSLTLDIRNIIAGLGVGASPLPWPPKTPSLISSAPLPSSSTAPLRSVTG